MQLKRAASACPAATRSACTRGVGAERAGCLGRMGVMIAGTCAARAGFARGQAGRRRGSGRRRRAAGQGAFQQGREQAVRLRAPAQAGTGHCDAAKAQGLVGRTDMKFGLERIHLHRLSGQQADEYPAGAKMQCRPSDQQGGSSHTLITADHHHVAVLPLWLLRRRQARQEEKRSPG